MIQEEIELLFQDLCVRLPYGVKVTFRGYSGREDCTLNSQHLNSTYSIEYLGLKPYLRSLSSMTESEREELKILCDKDLSEFAGHLMKGHGLSRDGLYMFDKLRQLNWLNKHHFDFRGLIDKGLAIEIDNETYEKIYGKID